MGVRACEALSVLFYKSIVIFLVNHLNYIAIGIPPTDSLLQWINRSAGDYNGPWICRSTGISDLMI